MSTIDYAAVRRYFEKAAEGASAAASYMAHGEDLPESAVHYRFARELEIIKDWLNRTPPSSTVLDVGCGSGAWCDYFANRYGKVIGIEGSQTMVEAAKERTRARNNVEILEADVRAELPDEEFQLIFLGGLCMYLEDADLVDLLRRLKQRLGVGGSIVLRESTVPHGARVVSGSYGALYRAPADYKKLFEKAGLTAVQTRRNLGYTAMETAIELVQARRRWLRFLPQRSAFLGGLTWYSLRLCAPLTFGLLPRALDHLDVTWPALQNHFFLLEAR